MRPEPRPTTLTLLAAAATACLPIASAAAADQDLVARGAYIARAADCMSCHSAEGGEPYAGGLPINTPFGKIYSNNITPDPETGIGGWTEQDFARVLHEGISKGGERIYPAMPYDSYTKMVDEDVHALWAYMQTVEPVKRETPPNELMFPFDIRSGLAVWQELYLDDERFQPDPAHDATWNRGAYLVEALGHCGSCHTPRNLMGASEDARELTGSVVDNWYAPNISSGPASGVRDWTVEELAAFLKTGRNDRNVAPVGPMAEVVHASLSQLTDADVHAMAVYLKEQPPPEEGPQAPETTTVVSDPRTGLGRELYSIHCSSCHKGDGQGVEGAAPTLAGNTAVTGPEPYNVIRAVLSGFEARAPWGAMPAFGGVLTDQQIAEVTNYVRATMNAPGDADTTAWTVGSLRHATDAPLVGETEPRFLCPAPSPSSGVANLRDAFLAFDSQRREPGAVQQLIDRVAAADPAASRGNLMDDMIQGYCPVVAQKELSYGQKGAALADFAGDVAGVLAKQRGKGAQPAAAP